MGINDAFAFAIDPYSLSPKSNFGIRGVTTFGGFSVDDARALARFQELRLPPMKKIWDASNVSLRWYEHMDEHMTLDPVTFAYNYMTRTGRVDHAEVRKRDPGLAAAYEKLHPELAAAQG